MLRKSLPIVLALVLALVFDAAPAAAQPPTMGAGDTSGVMVDAAGVLTRVTRDPSGRLTRQRLEAARMTPELREAARSPLRKISLQRLEAELARRLDRGEQPTDEMWNLAGLTRLSHVFYLPETGDIVIAGPAEPHFYDAEGEARGVDTLRPTLRLDDLAVALRAFPPAGRATEIIGCSIDPTPEGLARMQQFLSSLSGRATPANTGAIAQQLRDSLGMQEVSVMGVSPNTRFAHVLVSADYRMKLIGIGLEQPPVRMVTYIEAARPADGRTGLVRWYFVPDYESVRVSDDLLAMELVGQGVKLVGADEVVGADGSRRESGQATGASKQFIDSFTARYEEIANKEPVYAHLRNVIDLSVAAAFIQQQDYYSQSDWQLGALGDERRLLVERYHAPQQVATAVNAVWKGRYLMTPIGGGVRIQPRLALASQNTLADDGSLLELQEQLSVEPLPADRWWWD